MRRKNTVLVFSLLFFCRLSLSAETITKVAVIDMQKIFANYFKESDAWRSIDQLTNEIETISQRIEAEIDDLKMERISAVQNGNDLRAVQLEGLINEKETYLKEFVKVKTSIREQNIKSYYENSSTMKKINTAIEYVAESLGYSLVIDVRNLDLNVVWWSLDIDITQNVLSYLLR